MPHGVILLHQGLKSLLAAIANGLYKVEIPELAAAIFKD